MSPIIIRLGWLALCFTSSVNSVLFDGGEVAQVTTANGPVLGSARMTSVGSTPYFSFQGIPYAKPPVGKLRLVVPQPAEPWTTPLNLTGDSDVRCPQVL